MRILASPFQVSLIGLSKAFWRLQCEVKGGNDVGIDRPSTLGDKLLLPQGETEFSSEGKERESTTFVSTFFWKWFLSDKTPSSLLTPCWSMDGACFKLVLRMPDLLTWLRPVCTTHFHRQYHGLLVNNCCCCWDTSQKSNIPALYDRSRLNYDISLFELCKRIL